MRVVWFVMLVENIQAYREYDIVNFLSLSFPLNRVTNTYHILHANK